jgi:hypothetical protein
MINFTTAWRDPFDEDFGNMLLEYVDKPVSTKLVEEIVDRTIELLKSDKYRHSAKVQYLKRYWLGEEVKRHTPDNPERQRLHGLECDHLFDVRTNQATGLTEGYCIKCGAIA